MEAAAQTILSNAGLLLSEEYRLLSGVGGDVAELRDDMATMNALLRMQSEAEDGAVDHFVREWMKQLRELAYDAEDCVDRYVLRIKSRPNDGVRAWLERLLGTLLSRRRLACEISALRARAITISERHAQYGISREALRRSPAALSAPPPVSVSAAASLSSGHALRRASDDGAEAEHHHVVGIAGQADSLADTVKAPSVVEQDRSLKVFSVVGFGGVGKTTLAMEVCRRLEAEFQRQAMVSVSQAFEVGKDLKALLKRVLQQVVKDKTGNERGIKEEGNLDGIDKLNHTELATKLNDCLKDKRYLIVIDDVWTIRAWDAIQSVLPENNCDSRIIVTTRIDTVAKACSPAIVRGHYIHHMKPLELEDSKKLFLSRAFGSVDAKYSEELEDVIGNILKKCGGLPLAIVSIANVLAGYISSENKEKWETICRSIGTQMERNPTLEGMKHIVTLSYNHLPYELKSCMMYLSIFPEDYEINKDRLLGRWIAEGLVPEKRGLSLMEVAESYFDDLASRNMIELCFSVDGKVESCRVHDMLLEVMVSKSLECNFASLLGGQYVGMSYDRIRRLSIHGDNRSPLSTKQSKKKVGHVIEGMDVEHVRSLSLFHLVGHKLLDHLDKFTLLRVLDLEDCEGLTNYHMRYICMMYLLKFLSLKGTGISEVPSQVGKLEHLQILDTRHTGLGGLPKTVTNLEKLERLQFYSKLGWYVMWRLPRGLKRMKALRVVNNAILENNIEVAQEIGELEELQELTLYIDSGSIGDNTQVLEELAASLSKTYSLRSLNIGDLGWTKILKFLHSLPMPPRLLRYLRITGDMGGHLPKWIGSLTYLVEAVISWVDLSDDEPFGVLCKLPKLKSIVMERRYYTGDTLVARTSHNFPVLVNLTMTCDTPSHNPTPKVFEFEEKAMSKLERLNLRFHKYEKSIKGIEHLTNLREVIIAGTNNNPSVKHALEQLKAERGRRPESSRFQVSFRYE
ncbi:disease resistance protein Pik-2-like [Miscanthus floridulus]|uniref:disease resistance protein Pik-2-like n=1 Tax=Miscanthus floridulus TaxID=154761 RepID=UPI00345B0B07